MFHITNESILRQSTPLVFKRGSEYFMQRRIKSIQFNQEKITFDAAVFGTRLYDVNIRFDRNGDLQHAHCTCSDYIRSATICKHIAAVLLLIKDKDEQGFFKELKFRQVAKQVFSFFQNRPNTVKTTVELEVTYIFSKGGIASGSYSSFSLRIGRGKLYVVRDVKKFLECLEREEPVEFGKGFSFDPVRDGFSDEDKPLLNLLKEIYESEKLVDRLSAGYSKGSAFKDKYIYMSSITTKRFFDIMKDRPLKAQIQGTLFENVPVKYGDFPVNFTLSKDGKDLVLGIGFDGPLIPLTDDGEYFFSGQAIYKTSSRQQEYFKPFYLAMLYQQGSKIRFLEDDKERFVSEILPFAEKVGEVSIDQNVQELIEKIDIEPEIYVDQESDTVTAEVKFIYGDRIINPFSPMDKLTQPSDRILFRDVERERAILDILEETELKVKNGQVYLENEEKIFDFIYYIIPRLQEHARVFYSQSFRNITVRDSSQFSGKIRINNETDMLEFNFSIEGIDRSELSSIFDSLRERKKYYKLKDGTFLRLDNRELGELSGILGYLDTDSYDLQKDFIEIPKYRALYLDQHMRESKLHYIERSHGFKEFVQNIQEPADMDFTIPKPLKGVLRDYQRFGFKWLKTLTAYGLGGILADDMGLGKTLQVISLILYDREEAGRRPSLVIVPTSLVYNWCAEVEKFAPELTVLAVSGNKEERLKQMEGIEKADLVITSYPLIRRDIEDYRDYRFRYCILDEAQHIKNPDSQNARSVKEIKAERRFALTGTPMENTLSELWSIFDFILPGYLFSHSRFMERYERPIVKGEDPKALEELGKQIKPFILRRLKSDVLRELPEKIEHKMVAELTVEQKRVYLAYLEQIRDEIDREIREKGFGRSHIKILAGLTRLRQICCHPSTFLDGYKGESGKLQLLQELIEDSIESGHRILLFSQFTSMLHIIENWLKETKIDYLYLDGSTEPEERGKLVRAFNSGRGSLFLISLKAGGTGLNLTGADTVIHYDPWWNPAVEDQATDRAYRIGQMKSVHVMKLITKGTIEEKIFALQEKKKKLIDAVIQPGETMLNKMSEEEIMALFE